MINTVGKLETCLGKLVKHTVGNECLDVIKAIRFLGLRKWLQCLRATRKAETSAPKVFSHRLSVCAIMKNEGDYIREWIEYHRLAGIDKFYLYDNESTDDTHTILTPYVKSGLVDYTYFPIDKPQLPAYNDCIRRHASDTKWLAFIDLDEFIVPISATNLKDMLLEYENGYSQVVINWLLFGNNGLERRTEGLVIERFTRRGLRHWLSKAIVNPRKIYRVGVHEHIVGGRTARPDINTVRINHYHCKSWEEYVLKAHKGDVMFGHDHGMVKYQRACYDSHNLNDTTDTEILRFLPALKRVLGH